MIERPKSIGEAWRKMLQMEKRIEQLEKVPSAMTNKLAEKNREIDRLTEQVDFLTKQIQHFETLARTRLNMYETLVDAEFEAIQVFKRESP